MSCTHCNGTGVRMALYDSRSICDHCDGTGNITENKLPPTLVLRYCTGCRAYHS
jgi:DnaJ-class molecular chaperone